MRGCGLVGGGCWNREVSSSALLIPELLLYGSGVFVVNENDMVRGGEKAAVVFTVLSRSGDCGILVGRRPVCVQILLLEVTILLTMRHLGGCCC